MAQKESQGERVEKSSPFNLMPVELAAMGRKRVDEFLNAQTEFFDKLTETNRQWFDRVQSEAALSSELTSKLVAARSVPEAMAAWQEWSARRLEAMAEDGKHLFSDAQKFAETSVRLLSNGWSTKSTGGP